MSATLAVSYLGAAALAWAIARRERVHRPIGVYFALLAVAWTAEAIAGSLGDGSLDTARAAIASLGLWAIARAVMERRSAVVPLVIAAALAIAGALPALSGFRDPAQQGAWVAGTLGAMVSIGCAMRRGDEPSLAHLVVLGLTALGAAQIVIGPTTDWTGLVPSTAGALAAALAQALWLARTWRKKADDDRAERVRADERVGDLVDLEAPLRGRAASGGRAARGRVEP
jgi:hypothetical protein